ncbi:hypothetical protein NHX12_023136 [Muraenolepis orangiensis]|uniref:Uncharacterized protein n=1 Tax=Muraenolepis orangiensis TaxID=630683 RepID=A0A9Q0IRS3_9TELE|nr:hypothetical protein NHX12_023136 [Muraenolepis orangiensis]
MVEALAQNTNEYSFQERGTSVNTTAKEIEKMLGMYLKMGLVQMAGTRVHVLVEQQDGAAAAGCRLARFWQPCGVLRRAGTGKSDLPS